MSHESNGTNKRRVLTAEEAYRVSNLEPTYGARTEGLVVFDHCVAPEICAYIVERMRDHLEPSTHSLSQTHDPKVRNSKTCWLLRLRDPIIDGVGRYLTYVAGSPESVIEGGVRGQWYDVGEEFTPHWDFYRTDKDLETAATPQGGGPRNQRSWTAMLYLNTPESGGETAFPLMGIAVRPQVGRVVLWNNLLESGEPNPRMLHHATPVTAGFKAVAVQQHRITRPLWGPDAEQELQIRLGGAWTWYLALQEWRAAHGQPITVV